MRGRRTHRAADCQHVVSVDALCRHRIGRRAIREVLAAAAGGPPDLGALMGVMQRHGLTPAAPVPAS